MSKYVIRNNLLCYENGTDAQGNTVYNVWTSNSVVCPTLCYFVKLLYPQLKDLKDDEDNYQKITNIYFGLDVSRTSIAGSQSLNNLHLKDLIFSGETNWNYTANGVTKLPEYSRKIIFTTNAELPTGSSVLFTNENYNNGTLTKIPTIITAFLETGEYGAEDSTYSLYVYDKPDYKFNASLYLSFIGESYNDDAHKKGPWHKLLLPLDPTQQVSSTNKLYSITITYKEYQGLYDSSKIDSTESNDKTTVYNSIKNVDVNQDGFYIDYTLMDSENPESEPIYLQNNGVSTEKVYNVKLANFNFPLFTVKSGEENTSNYEWTTKFNISKYDNVFKNIFILIDGLDERYPLYSPELLKIARIGYIRSDWISFDDNGNTIVKWWPERSLCHFTPPSLMEDEQWNKGINLDDLKEYTEENPLIGTIYSYRTAEYTMLNHRKITDKYNFIDNTLLPIKSHNDLYNYDYIEVVMPVINNAWKTTDDYWTKYKVELVGLSVKDDEINITNNEPIIQQMALWKYDLSYDANVLYYIDDSMNTTNNVCYSVKDISNLSMLLNIDGNGYIQYDRYYVFYDETQDFINPQYTNKELTNEIYSIAGYPITWLDSTGNIKTASLRVAAPDDSNVEDEVKEMISKQPDLWKTPSEFYNTDSNLIYEESDKGYQKSETNSENSKYVNWWWCDTLQNWCLFLYTTSHKLNLYVWNGKNGWDNLETIVNNLKYNNIRAIKKTYHYNPEIFHFGTTYSEYTDRDKSYDQGKIIYNIIKLPKDNNMGTWDENSFQNVHSTYHQYDNGGTGYHPSSTQGVPPIIRLPSHELGLCYRFTARGRTVDQDMVREDNLSFINSCCVAFFGDGSDKTIKEDWKQSKYDLTEEKPNNISDETEETLYNCEHINTSIKDNDNLTISFSVPRPNVITQNNTKSDYILRWE